MAHVFNGEREAAILRIYAVMTAQSLPFFKDLAGLDRLDHEYLKRDETVNRVLAFDECAEVRQLRRDRVRASRLITILQVATVRLISSSQTDAPRLRSTLKTSTQPYRRIESFDGC